MKECYRCKEIKEDSEFWKTCAYCKGCDNEYRREWRNKKIQEYKDRRSELWKRKFCRRCVKCGVEFVGKGRKREYCTTSCKLKGNIIKKRNGCWEWKGDLHPNGYGYTTNYETNKREHVHRISFRIFKGEIPKGLYVCHHCDNRKCINPEHLFVGTAKDNMQDAKRKGRLKNQHGRILTSENRR